MKASGNSGGYLESKKRWWKAEEKKRTGTNIRANNGNLKTDGKKGNRHIKYPRINKAAGEGVGKGKWQARI